MGPGWMNPRVVPWAPGVARGNPFRLARMWASMGYSDQEIRIALTTGPVTFRAQDVTRSINLARTWANRMQGPDAPVGNQVIPREWQYGMQPNPDGSVGQPSRYRYVVAIRGDDDPSGSQEWRTIIIHSQENLSIDQIRERAFAVFGDLEGRYSRFRGTGIHEESEWRIQLASYQA